MPIAFWRDEYVTGIDIIDQQHQSLFTLINTLHEAMVQGHGHDVLLETVNKLVIYVKEHFETEEKVMEQYQYPGLQEHRELHQKLTQDVLDFKAKMEKKEPFLTVEVSRFLTEWLIHHIKGEDLKMINYLQEKISLEKRGIL